MDRASGKRKQRDLLVFLCANEAGLVHEACDIVGFVRVLGYLVHDAYGGE